MISKMNWKPAILIAAGLMLGAAGCSSPALAVAPGAVNSGPASAATQARGVKAPSASGNSNGASWWPAELAMPQGSTFVGVNKVAESTTTGTAIWESKSTDLDAMQAFVIDEASTAGYTTFTEPIFMREQRVTYMIKGANAYELSITNTDDKRTLLGTRVGVLQLKTSGGVSATIELPLSSGSGCSTTDCAFQLMSHVVNPKCDGCEYNLSVYVTTPFKGPGAYSAGQAIAKPGDDRGQPYVTGNGCQITITDNLRGTFDCKGLENQSDRTDTLDMSGSWQLPN